MTLVMEKNPTGPTGWATPDVTEMCQLSNRLYVDVSDVARKGWDSGDDPTDEMTSALCTDLEPLFRLLQLKIPHPSLNTPDQSLPNPLVDMPDPAKGQLSALSGINGRTPDDAGNRVHRTV